MARECERNTQAEEEVSLHQAAASPTTGDRPQAEEQSAEDQQQRDHGPCTPDKALVIGLSQNLRRDGGPHLSKFACAKRAAPPTCCATYVPVVAPAGRPLAGPPDRRLAHRRCDRAGRDGAP